MNLGSVSDSSPEDRRDRGLRPFLSQACRAFLRAGADDAAAAAHQEVCADCRLRMAGRASLQAALRVRPPVPVELASAAFRDSIFERIIEQAEVGPLGAALERAMPISRVPDLSPPTELGGEQLARNLFRQPAPPSSEAWASARRAILAETGVGSGRRWWLGVGGIAAAAIICGLLLSDGTSEEPAIVFTDVSTMPSVDFAVLRHGLPR
jgi:hypothetical protein